LTYYQFQLTLTNADKVAGRRATTPVCLWNVGCKQKYNHIDKLVERTQKAQMEKSKIAKFIGKTSSVFFIILFAVNLWLNGNNSTIERAMWMFGCVSILWIFSTINLKQTKK
jgi:cation transport ATPase